MLAPTPAFLYSPAPFFLPNLIPVLLKDPPSPPGQLLQGKPTPDPAPGWPGWSQGDPFPLARTESGMGMWADSGQWDKREILLNGVGTGAEKYFIKWKPQEEMASCLALKVVMSLWLPELLQPEDGATGEGAESIAELPNQRHHISLLLKATWGGISETYTWKHPYLLHCPYSAVKLTGAFLLCTQPSEDANFS